MAFSEYYVPYFLILLAFSNVEIARSTRSKTCPETHCPSSPLIVKFPFRLTQYQDDLRCGYPGFELSCDNRSGAIVSLPSGDFTVRSILYDKQKLRINDPEDYCLPKRLLEKNFSVSGTNFAVENLIPFIFLNCSLDVVETDRESLMEIACMSTDNFTVAAVPKELFFSPPPSSCRVISTALFPATEWCPGNWGTYLNTYIELMWKEPSCGICEQRGEDCGFKLHTDLQIHCSNMQNFGLAKGIQYGILTIAGALFVILCFAGLHFINRRLLRGNREASDSASTITDSTTTRHYWYSGPGRVGLEGPIIESYPKTQVGESGRVPQDGQTTCSICLSEYKPRDTLRTLPLCNHYFHDHCIDQWLRFNATCPLCRNLPRKDILIRAPAAYLFSP